MLFQVFFLSFGISLLGTIPPATINITVVQLSIKSKVKSAVLLSLGAVLIDTVYAGLAVSVQIYLAEQLEFTNYFYLIAALVLLVLGIASIKTKSSVSNIKIIDDGKVGLLKGILLGLLNPLAMPFWLGVTTYLQLNGLINLMGINFWSYLIGVFLGEFALLMIIIRIGRRFTKVANNRTIVHTIPGIAFIFLAIVNFVQWASYYL
jgi:threonine/homoserine/homoserine lactone efflux protein